MDGGGAPRDVSLAWTFAPMIALALVGIGIWFIANERADRFSGVALACTAAFFMVLHALGESRARKALAAGSGPCQLRLCPDGWGFRSGLGNVKIIPWQGDVTVEVARFSDKCCTLSIARTKKMLLATLKRRDVPIESAAIIVEGNLQDLVPVVGRAAGWLGTTVAWRLSDRKDWIVRAQRQVS